MLYRYRFLLLGLLLLTCALPAAAAERVDTVPATKTFSSVRFEIALLQNSQPFLVGKGEMSSADRGHFVLKTLPGSGAELETLEIVVYDGAVYTRENDSTQWYIEQSSVPVNPPGTSVDTSSVAGPISLIGPVTVAGTPTNQYQIWSSSASGGMDHTALDLFIGQQANYLYQLQISAFTGSEKAELVYRFLDFDDSTIVVAQPAGAVARTTSILSPLTPFRYKGPFATLAVPLGAHVTR